MTGWKDDPWTVKEENGSSFNYNPNNPAFGGTLTLTTKEGIVYEVDGNTGDTKAVRDRNGNKLTFTDGGIFSATGQEITFPKDGGLNTNTIPLWLWKLEGNPSRRRSRSNFYWTFENWHLENGCFQFTSPGKTALSVRLGIVLN